jgi:hypothetical protein
MPRCCAGRSGKVFGRRVRPVPVGASSFCRRALGDMWQPKAYNLWWCTCAVTADRRRMFRWRAAQQARTYVEEQRNSGGNGHLCAGDHRIRMVPFVVSCRVVQPLFPLNLLSRRHLKLARVSHLCFCFTCRGESRYSASRLLPQFEPTLYNSSLFSYYFVYKLLSNSNAGVWFINLKIYQHI